MQTTEWTIMGFRFGIAGVHRALVLVVVAGCSDSGSRPAMPNDATSAKTGHEASTSQQTSDNEHPETSLRFDDVTSKTGIRFVNRNGEEAGQFAIVESLGGGVGVIDFDRDGNDDLLLPGGGNMAGDAEPIGLSCGLYRNRTAWQFDDVTAVSGTHEPRKYSHGCASCDFDNDGFPDAVVTGFGGLLFFRNLGDGTFEEVAASSGLNDHLWSSSAAWGDVTNDGLVDLYVAHYVNWSPTNNPFCPGPDESTREVCPPRDFEGLPDVFYVGQGDGTFSDKSSDFGLRPDGKGLGVLIADLDDDRDLDVYITNDTVPNVLYRNENGKVFEDSSLISGASLSARGVPDGSMGVQLLDYDQNGRFDIWVANYERETSALYESQGNLLFRHVSQRSGVTAVGAMYVGWGTVCFDAEHDGDEDVFVANGHVIRYPRAAPLEQTPLLMENLNGRRFRNVAELAGEYMRTGHMARGCATSDLDHDGDLDIVVMHTNAPVTLLKNSSDTKPFLILDLFGTTSSRDAIGVSVSVVTDVQTVHRQWSGGGSYASTNSRQLHFGLGDAKTVKELVVRWPSGVTQSFNNIAPNSRLAVVESRDAVIFK